MKIDLSTERKEQARVFYQNEHNLASKNLGILCVCEISTVVYSFFLSPSSLSQREDHLIV